MPLSRPSEIKQLVSDVALKLRLTRLISELGFAVAVTFFAFAALLVLSIPFDLVKSGWAAIGLGGFISALLVYIWFKAWTSVDAQDAARYLDERAGLKDEVLSALWFMESKRKHSSVGESAFVMAHLERAVARIQPIKADTMVPLRVPQSGKIAVIAILFFAVTWVGTSNVVTAHKSDLDVRTIASSENINAASNRVSGRQEATDIKEINEALDVLQRDDVSFEAKKEALRKAREVLDQINMDAVMTREGLSKLSKILLEQKGFEAVGRALEQGKIQEALMLLKEKQEELAALSDIDGQLGIEEQKAGATVRSENISSAELGDAARDLLNEVGRPDPRNITRLIENLEQAQQQMESQERANTAASRMESAGERMGLAQTNAAELGGRSATSDQVQASNGSPSPDAGNNDMSGGSLFRQGAVNANEKDKGDDGSSTGAPEGHAAALALEGRMTQRLDAVLRLEKTQVKGDDSVEGEESAWEFQASKRAKARTETVQGLDSGTYDDVDVINGEFVSVEQRQAVQQYFLEIHEGNKR
ncbi:MAG: hypothetical protein O3B03_00970 [Proteobacteria bacterium]|nr:hypothetical protein [Pseudomonadota bacterium]MDA1331056.1 hypothetical protein [Pseudomonadota bacterium]